MRGTRLLLSRAVWLVPKAANVGGCVVVAGSRPLSSTSSTTAAASQMAAVVVNEHKHSNLPPMRNHPQHAETATALVDGLLSYTRELMDAPRTKKTTSEDNNNDYMHIRHVVAFSGGIDSSLVLALLKQASSDLNGGQEKESVHAVIGRSSALPQDQLDLARRVSQHIGIPLVEVETTEGTDETYIANNGQACLACKTHLYSALQAVAEHATATVSSNSTDHDYEDNPQSYNNDNEVLLYNGTNANDVQDTTRVGLLAARNFQVQSPLLYTTKENVRKAAQHLGLPNWNVAASPCLRSRLALGVHATQEHLQRIEAAESFVRQELKNVLSITSNLRVRLLAGNQAMLEVDTELLPQVQAAVRGAVWQDHFIQTLTFASLRVRAFQSGSVSKKNNEEHSNV